MIDHQFEQGLVWTETPDGPEQVCRVCGQRAVYHGTAPAVYGRVPWPETPGPTDVPEPVAPTGRLSAFLHRLTHPKPGPADHVFQTPEVGRSSTVRMGAR